MSCGLLRMRACARILLGLTSLSIVTFVAESFASPESYVDPNNQHYGKVRDYAKGVGEQVEGRTSVGEAVMRRVDAAEKNERFLGIGWGKWTTDYFMSLTDVMTHAIIPIGDCADWKLLGVCIKMTALGPKPDGYRQYFAPVNWADTSNQRGTTGMMPEDLNKLYIGLAEGFWESGAIGFSGGKALARADIALLRTAAIGAIARKTGVSLGSVGSVADIDDQTFKAVRQGDFQDLENRATNPQNPATGAVYGTWQLHPMPYFPQEILYPIFKAIPWIGYCHKKKTQIMHFDPVTALGSEWGAGYFLSRSFTANRILSSSIFNNRVSDPFRLIKYDSKWSGTDVDPAPDPLNATPGDMYTPLTRGSSGNCPDCYRGNQHGWIGALANADQVYNTSISEQSVYKAFKVAHKLYPGEYYDFTVKHNPDDEDEDKLQWTEGQLHDHDEWRNGEACVQLGHYGREFKDANELTGENDDTVYNRAHHWRLFRCCDGEPTFCNGGCKEKISE